MLLLLDHTPTILPSLTAAHFLSISLILIGTQKHTITHNAWTGTLALAAITHRTSSNQLTQTNSNMYKWRHTTHRDIQTHRDIKTHRDIQTHRDIHIGA